MCNSSMISEVGHRVYFSDTDSGGVVYFGNISRYMEIGFSEWFRQYTGSLKELNEKYNIFLLVKTSSHKFKKPIYYDNELIIRTKVRSIKFFSIGFKIDIIVHGHVCFEGEVTLTPIDLSTKKTVKLPDEILALTKEGEHEIATVRQNNLC